MMAGAFVEVVKELELESSGWSQSDWRRPGTLGLAYMAVGRHNEANASFCLSSELASRSSVSGRSVYDEWIGVSYWLQGQRSEAADVWFRYILAVRSKDIRFTDISGGIDVGLIAFYCGVTLRNERLIDNAKSFLRWASKRAAAQNMPGPLALCVVGGLPLSEVLASHFNCQSLSMAVSTANNDALKSRQLCQTLFVAASIARETKKEGEAMLLFRQTASLQNTLLQCEWYLASNELTNIELTKPSADQDRLRGGPPN